MRKIFSNVISSVLWIVDLALAFWLFYFIRTAYLDIFALFYKTGNTRYSHTVDFLDKAIIILLGLAWLALMIIVEEYFRAGIQKGDMLKRFARITGPLLLCIFAVDLILAWLQGIGGGNWLRWIILAGELGIGITLIVSAKKSTLLKTN